MLCYDVFCQALFHSQIAVACIKVASQAVGTMPSLFFFPILPFIMTVCLIVYWVVVAGYLYSAGTITAKMTTPSTSSALTISVSPSVEVSASGRMKSSL